MSATRESDAGQEGTTFLVTPLTPRSGRWVLTDVGRATEDAPAHVSGDWELAWSVDGTMRGYHSFGVFADRACLLAAVHAVEGCRQDERRPYEAMIGDAGFERSRERLQFDVSYLRTLPDGRTARLGTGSEVRMDLIEPGRPGLACVAAVRLTSAHEALRRFGSPSQVAMSAVLAALLQAVPGAVP